MAYTTTNLRGNSRVVRKFDNVSVDFPPNGVVCPAGSPGVAIAVAAVTGASLTVSVTFDEPTAISAGTATWYPYSSGTTAVGASNYIEFLVSPSGIKLSGSTAGAAILC